jgi:hypothetical protein
MDCVASQQPRNAVIFRQSAARSLVEGSAAIDVAWDLKTDEFPDDAPEEAGGATPGSSA